MRKSRRFRPVKVGDIVVVGLLLAALFFIPTKKGRNIKIFVDGRQFCVYPLNMDTTITIQGYRGPATFQIQKGKVRMLNSTCPLKLCVKRGRISKAGESIICLPNRITIFVEGKANWDVITE